MSRKSNSTGGGIGVLGIVFIVFLVLKLTKVGVVADWSWWKVTSPIWIPIASLCVMAILLSPFLIFSYLRKKKIRKIMNLTGMNYRASSERAKKHFKMAEIIKEGKESRTTKSDND